MLVIKSIKPKTEGLEDSLLMAHAILNIVGNQKEDMINIEDIYFACKAAKSLLPSPEDMEKE